MTRSRSPKVRRSSRKALTEGFEGARGRIFDFAEDIGYNLLVRILNVASLNYNPGLSGVKDEFLILFRQVWKSAPGSGGLTGMPGFSIMKLTGQSASR